jgi:proteasome lid subunit RPN8/RPN11
MMAQAFAELPNECCGFLAGRPVSADPAAAAALDKPGQGVPVARVMWRYPLINEAKSPVTYNAESRSMFQAIRHMRRKGWEILAIYHSHPTSDAIPSRTDLERNYYGEGVIYLIISFKGKKLELRGWWLRERDYRPAEWEYVD